MKERILKKGFFKLARNESLKSNHRIKIGAVLSKNGNPISVGHNIPTKCTPQIRKLHKFKTLHAEIDACIGIDKSNLNGSVLYVYRETADGNVSLSKPCEMCQSFLKQCGIKKVFYTTENNFNVMRLK